MLQATYVYLQAPSLEKLLEQVTADVLANPPLHHDPAAAAQEIAAETAKESAAAAEQPQLFDAVVVHNPQVWLCHLCSLTALVGLIIVALKADSSLRISFVG